MSCGAWQLCSNIRIALTSTHHTWSYSIRHEATQAKPRSKGRSPQRQLRISARVNDSLTHNECPSLDHRIDSNQRVWRPNISARQPAAAVVHCPWRVKTLREMQNYAVSIDKCRTESQSSRAEAGSRTRRQIGLSCAKSPGKIGNSPAKKKSSVTSQFVASSFYVLWNFLESRGTANKTCSYASCATCASSQVRITSLSAI